MVSVIAYIITSVLFITALIAALLYIRSLKAKHLAFADACASEMKDQVQLQWATKATLTTVVGLLEASDQQCLSQASELGDSERMIAEQRTQLGLQSYAIANLAEQLIELRAANSVLWWAAEREAAALEADDAPVDLWPVSAASPAPVLRPASPAQVRDVLRPRPVFDAEIHRRLLSGLAGD